MSWQNLGRLVKFATAHPTFYMAHYIVLNTHGLYSIRRKGKIVCEKINIKDTKKPTKVIVIRKCLRHFLE